MAYIGFAALKAKIAKGGAKNPGAVAASIGRKKYGKENMQKMASNHKTAPQMGLRSLMK